MKGWTQPWTEDVCMRMQWYRRFQIRWTKIIFVLISKIYGTKKFFYQTVFSHNYMVIIHNIEIELKRRFFKFDSRHPLIFSYHFIHSPGTQTRSNSIGNSWEMKKLGSNQWFFIHKFCVTDELRLLIFNLKTCWLEEGNTQDKAHRSINPPFAAVILLVLMSLGLLLSLKVPLWNFLLSPAAVVTTIFHN